MDKSYVRAVVWLLTAARHAEQMLRATQCDEAADRLAGAITRMEKREQARIRLEAVEGREGDRGTARRVKAREKR